jgi:2'-5' RNA ligase
MRLFTGIAIAADTQDNVASALKVLRPLAPLKWMPIGNLHITNKFIGNWPAERLTELKGALEGATAVRPFDIKIAGFGYFPNPQAARALFAGVEAGPALAELARLIEDALWPLGVARDERPYAPHLTLARIKHENIRELREHIATMTNFDFGTFPVPQFHLYLSTTGPRGSVYTSLASYPLRTDANDRTGLPR